MCRQCQVGHAYPSGREQVAAVAEANRGGVAAACAGEGGVSRREACRPCSESKRHGPDSRRRPVMTSGQSWARTKGSTSDRFMAAGDVADAPCAEFVMIVCGYCLPVCTGQRPRRCLLLAGLAREGHSSSGASVRVGTGAPWPLCSLLLLTLSPSPPGRHPPARPPSPPPTHQPRPLWCLRARQTTRRARLRSRHCALSTRCPPADRARPTGSPRPPSPLSAAIYSSTASRHAYRRTGQAYIPVEHLRHIPRTRS